MPGTQVMGRLERIPFDINETDTLAGTSFEAIAPCKGFVKAIYVVVAKAVTTGGTVKVQVGTTDVAGATVTVANSATKGTIYSAEATEGSSTRVVAKGDRIQIVPDAAFATGGAVNGFVEFSTGR